MSEEKEIPSPRFDLINTMFDEIDEILAKTDQGYHLTIFEMEILMLMLRKKVEHLGIMTALEPDLSGGNNASDGNNDPYK